VHKVVQIHVMKS